jgi:tetratricopeptide (TPR) repeat protein
MPHLDHRRVLLALAAAGIAIFCLARPRVLRLDAAHAYVEASDLLQRRRASNELMRAGRFFQAIEEYQRGYDEAQRRGDPRSARRFLSNLGVANFRLLRYRDAAKAFLQVRTLAESQGDHEALAAVAVNLSSLYFETGELDAAIESARLGLALPAGASSKFRPQLLTQSALIELRQGKCQPAASLLRQVIELSRDEINPAAEAQAWNELGNALLECKQPADAEAALLEAYRIRKLTRDDRLYYSYESLAELRLAMNDPAAALELLDHAIAASPRGPAALWRFLYSRGRANRMLGRLQAAYHDFEASLADSMSKPLVRPVRLEKV